jgi:phage tail protein X
MKKNLTAVLIIACLFVTGCAGNPEPAPATPVIEQAPVVTLPDPEPVTASPEPVVTLPEPEPIVIVTLPAPEPTPVIVTPPRLRPVASGQEIVMKEAGNYRVVRGDSFSIIAVKLYGRENMFYFPLIRLANMTITNPDVLRAGANIIVPDLQANLNNETARILLKAEMLSTAEHYERQNQFNASAELRNLANKL